MQASNFIHITAGIAQVIEAEEKLLSSLPVEVITQRRNRQNRTIKQILGHLIDSASKLWKCYNLHIIQVINSVDKNRLDSYWCDFTGAKITLREMIEGYLGHLHLHIKEIHELID